MASSQLRSCPYCHQSWPHGTDYDLRGAHWLDPLPRNITVSNGDVLIHDGSTKRDRFLLIETKMPWESAMQAGQAMLLRAVARQPDWTVRILRGRLPRPAMHRVASDGVEERGTEVSASDMRLSVSDWLRGERWSDPPGVPMPARRVLYPVGTPLTAPRPCPACKADHPVGTTCAGGLWPWEPTP